MRGARLKTAALYIVMSFKITQIPVPDECLKFVQCLSQVCKKFIRSLYQAGKDVCEKYITSSQETCKKLVKSL